MSLPVHLVPSLEGVAAGSVVRVDGAEAHHAVVVRRLRAGESLVLTDGVGGSAVGEVVVAANNAFEVAVSSVRLDTRPEPEVVVVQAIPKGERGELAVEVLTEVGAGVVVPWAAARCVAVWKGDRATKSLARWRSTAREAAKQARRTWHPQVTDLATTAAVVNLVTSADLAVVLHEASSAALASLPVPATGRVVVVVGPEGGLTDGEVAALTAAGAVSVRLGTEVLRTSTAGVAAVAALLARTPRWS
ncbi:MAG: 16S rRNA (uracil(1498)-N(3))-methyltransferase [Nocardioides sp.]